MSPNKSEGEPGSASQLWLASAPIILASGSATRRLILQSAGMEPEVWPATVDERALEASFADEGLGPDAIARRLAEAKAIAVSATRPGRIVLGADQTLAVGSAQLHKPGDAEGVERTLRTLSGRAHALHSGVALAVDGALIWSHVETARLHVRALSDAFIDRYVMLGGKALFSSVGGYQYEGLGVHLFDRIEGDQSTILGLPLLPLLDELRRRGHLLA
ncbi:MAG: Maf family protein [Beijerinckiaceae bacterium]|nr:Maf family protein [Beijerinckiaceae bacterium]